MRHLTDLFNKHWGAIVILSLMGAVAGMWLSLQQMPLYASNTRVLITQKSVSTDAYTTLRAAERMGVNLTHVMDTASFLDKVLQSGFSVRDEFPKDEASRRARWEEMLEVSVLPDSSILDITILHADREQAERIVAATSKVLIANAKDYLGIENLNIQVVDAPLTSVTPVKPQIPMNTAMGFIIGFILSTGITILRELFTPSRAQAAQSLLRTPAPKPVAQTPVVIAPPPPVKSVPAAPVMATESAQPTAAMRAPVLPKPTLPFEESKESPVRVQVPPVPSATDAVQVIENIKTMHDHAKIPFGGNYFFQHKLIQLDELKMN